MKVKAFRSNDEEIMEKMINSWLDREKIQNDKVIGITQNTDKGSIIIMIWYKTYVDGMKIK